MSEKDKKSKQTPEENAVAEQPVNETPEAAAEAAPETYTVTKEQMQQMEELAKTLADANDKYLRLAAEYDNYRKRTAREKEHLYGGFSFVLESDGYTSFGDKAVRPLVQNFDVDDYRFGRATHGYLPDFGAQPVFVAKGPDFRCGVTLERGLVVDEAPTYAKLLGVELPQADGRPMEQFLR